jgi:hypothetical protein
MTNHLIKIIGGKIIAVVFIVCSLFSSSIFSQSDSSYALPLVSVHYGGNLPSGDLKDRFGANFNTGVGYKHKFKKGWLLNVEWSFLFANKVKEDSLFKNILNPEGYIIDNDGKNGSYKVMERGHLVTLSFGKLIKTFQNENSGILFTLGASYLQHKIRIHNNSNNIPQINYAYKFGYDHLTNGFGPNIFLGYLYTSSNNYVNFFGGFDATIAYTKNRRYNFDTQSVNNSLRTDILYGFKFGIILPIYSKRVDGKYFYN